MVYIMRCILLVLLGVNFPFGGAFDLSNLSKESDRNLQSGGTSYACIINGINYCQPSEINVPGGGPTTTTATPVTSPTISGPVPAPTYPSPVAAPSSPRPTLAPVLATSSPVTSSPIATSLPTFKATLEPSDRPSQGPTPLPTLNPTPTPVPTATFSPSSLPTDIPTTFPSTRPSSIPSQPPSRNPSSTPSVGPTIAPSISAAPSMDPDAYDTRIKVGEDGFPKAVSICRREIPARAENITNQLIAFDYVLNILPGSSVQLSMSTVTMRLHNALTENYLDCRFDTDPSQFYTAKLNSNPGDELSNTTCDSEQRYENNECYIVKGALTVRTFYLRSVGSSRRNRRLILADSNSTVIRDRNVAKSFSASLKDVFESDIFDTSTIASTTFLGVTNSVVESKNEAAVIAGSVVGSLFVVGLICGLLVLAVQRYPRREREYAVEMKDQHSLSLYEDQSETTSGDVLSADREEEANVLGPVIFSDNDSLNQTERLEVVAGSMGDHGRYTRPPQPAAEDDALDELVARTMMSRIRRDLGPRTAPASPRRYDIDDTVDL